MFARQRSDLLALFALASALGLPALASAQQDQTRQQSRDEPYFAGKLLLGVAGEAGIDAADLDMELSYGLGFAYMHPLHRNFALGAQLAVQSWQTEAGADFDADRNVFADLTLVPQARLPLTRDVELYMALPVGLSLDFFNGPEAIGIANLAGVDVDPAFGFTLSLVLGARFALSDSFGLLAELGYTMHSFSHDVGLEGAGAGLSLGDIDIDLEQLAVHAGVYF